MWQLDLIIYSWVCIQSIIYIGFCNKKTSVDEVYVSVHNIWVKNAVTASIVNTLLMFANTWSVLQLGQWKDDLMILAVNVIILSSFAVCLLKRYRNKLVYTTLGLMSFAGIVYINMVQSRNSEISMLIPILISLTVGVTGVLLMDLTIDLQFLYHSSLQSLLDMYQYYSFILQTQINYIIVAIIGLQPMLSIYCWYTKVLSNRDGDGVILMSFGGVFLSYILVCMILNLLSVTNPDIVYTGTSRYSITGGGGSSGSGGVSVETQEPWKLLIPGQTEPFPSDMNG